MTKLMEFPSYSNNRSKGRIIQIIYSKLKDFADRAFAWQNIAKEECDF